eukprot:Colp12_sorted_trinity150504_noHs@18306
MISPARGKMSLKRTLSGGASPNHIGRHLFYLFLISFGLNVYLWLSFRSTVKVVFAVERPAVQYQRPTTLFDNACQPYLSRDNETVQAYLGDYKVTPFINCAKMEIESAMSLSLHAVFNDTFGIQLHDLLSRWTGPISMAVLLEPGQELKFLTLIASTPEFMDRLDIHVVYSKAGHSVPHNVLRSVSIINLRTKYALAIDGMEFHWAENGQGVLEKMIPGMEILIAHNPRRASAIATLETLSNAPVKDAAEMKEYVKNYMTLRSRGCVRHVQVSCLRCNLRTSLSDSYRTSSSTSSAVRSPNLYSMLIAPQMMRTLRTSLCMQRRLETTFPPPSQATCW